MSKEDIQQWQKIRDRYERDIRPQIHAISGQQRVPDVSDLLLAIMSLSPDRAAEKTDRLMILILALMYRYSLEIGMVPSQSVALWFEGNTTPIRTIPIARLVGKGDTEIEYVNAQQYIEDWTTLRKYVMPTETQSNERHGKKKRRCEVM
jgi:hypothetical protein